LHSKKLQHTPLPPTSQQVPLQLAARCRSRRGRQPPQSVQLHERARRQPSSPAPLISHSAPRLLRQRGQICRRYLWQQWAHSATATAAAAPAFEQGSKATDQE